MSPWLDRRFYDVVFWTTWPFFSLFNSMRVIGRHNVPKTGGVLVISNHQSFLDPDLVGIAVPRYLRYLARHNLFHNRLLGWFIKCMGAIPIDRDMGKDGLKATLKEIDGGACLLMFPEGERTHDGELQPFKPGLSLLIRRMTAPIVPVALVGPYHTLSRHAKRPSFSPLFQPPTEAAIAISIGKPIPAEDVRDLPRDEMLKRLEAAVAVEFEKAKKLQRKRRG